jgi:hypothetical protein
MATLTNFVVKVQNEMDDFSSSTQNVIERNLQSIYQQIVQKLPQRLIGTTVETHTAVVGTSNYSTNTEPIQILSVKYKTATGTDYTDLTLISEKEYLDNNYVNLDNSTPDKYYIKKGVVYLVAPPSDAGTIQITYIPITTELTGDNVSIIPTRYEDVLIMGALYRCYAYEKGSEAVEYKRMYEEALANMMAELRTQNQPIGAKLFGI